MKRPGFPLLIGICSSLVARADVTIVQKVEEGGSITDMTIKIKADKTRIEATPQATMLMDGKTGEMITLMNDQKRFLRISRDKMKAMTEMAGQFSADKPASGKPKLTPTGKKETVDGYEAEEYVSETSSAKMSYWITTKYPNYSEILKQMQATQPAWLDLNKQGMPDYRDLPGLPIRTRMTIQGKDFTSTIVSIKQDLLSDAEFSIPKDFQEMKMPDFLGGKPAAGSPSPNP